MSPPASGQHGLQCSIPIGELVEGEGGGEGRGLQLPLFMMQESDSGDSQGNYPVLLVVYTSIYRPVYRPGGTCSTHTAYRGSLLLVYTLQYICPGELAVHIMNIGGTCCWYIHCSL